MCTANSAIFLFTLYDVVKLVSSTVESINKLSPNTSRELLLSLHLLLSQSLYFIFSLLLFNVVKLVSSTVQTFMCQLKFFDLITLYQSSGLVFEFVY